MNVSISISALLIDNAKQFVIAAYSDAARTILAEQQNPVKPYAAPFQATFVTLTPGKMYYFVLWESQDGTASGAIRNSCNFQANSQVVSIRADLWLTADATPGLVSGASGYVDPSNSLLGWDYTLHEPGYGPMQPTVDIMLDPLNNWALVGNTVQPLQRFVCIFKPQISQAITAQPSLISSSVVLTQNTSLDNTYKNKAILLQGAGASFIINLPPTSSVADFDVYYFYSCGGSHKNVSIRCVGTDKVQRNVQVIKIVLGQNEVLKLFKIGGLWFVDNPLTGVDSVGQLVESNYLNVVNTAQFIGTLVSRITYERLWDIVQLYASGLLISEASWANTDANGNYINKGFFSTGDGSTTFRLPDLTIYPTRRAVNSRLSGSFELQTLLSHNHPNGIADDLGTNDASNIWVYGSTKIDMPGTAKGTVNDEAGHALTYQGLTGLTGSNENKSSNTGIYLLCRI